MLEALAVRALRSARRTATSSPPTSSSLPTASCTMTDFGVAALLEHPRQRGALSRARAVQRRAGRAAHRHLPGGRDRLPPGHGQASLLRYTRGSRAPRVRGAPERSFFVQQPHRVAARLGDPESAVQGSGRSLPLRERFRRRAAPGPAGDRGPPARSDRRAHRAQDPGSARTGCRKTRAGRRAEGRPRRAKPTAVPPKAAPAVREPILLRPTRRRPNPSSSSRSSRDPT